MKRIWSVALLAALVLTGCSGPTQSDHPEWDDTWARLGDKLAVEPVPDFELSEINDALAASGIYYAVWNRGEGQDFINAEGEDALVYQAQIYLLLQECQSAEDAGKAVESWMDREAETYGTERADNMDLGGQSYRCLSLLSSREGNPYTHGAAAFADRGSTAISVELVCSEDFEGELQSILEQFLSGIHYGD